MKVQGKSNTSGKLLNNSEYKNSGKIMMFYHRIQLVTDSFFTIYASRRHFSPHFYKEITKEKPYQNKMNFHILCRLHGLDRLLKINNCVNSRNIYFFAVLFY